MSRKAKLYLLRDELIEHARNAPNTVSKSRWIAKRFEEHAKECFTFIDVDYVSPSNNFAEISVRGFVIDRKIRYFSQSMLGIYVIEALRSILDTLKLKGMDKKKFLVEALTVASKREPLPSLAYPGQKVDQKFVKEADDKYKLRVEAKFYENKWKESSRSRTNARTQTNQP